jgi:transcriptional regulator with XRE-family HTH domain
MVLFRRLLGEVLRSRRIHQGRTLRQVSADARVSLGYISEIERGQKEASSEMLAALCAALDAPLSEILSEVSDAVALEEAAVAMRLEDQLETTLDTSRLPGHSTIPEHTRVPERSGLDEHGEDGRRRGDVVVSAA